MGPTRTLQFVPYVQARSNLSLGDEAKRVAMTGRSPSPPLVSPPRSKPTSAGPRRIAPQLLQEPPTPTASTSTASSSGRSDSLLPNSPAVSAPTTPSRKGKEREVATPNGTPNGIAKTPNGVANGVMPNGLANGSAKDSPKAKEARTPKSPKANGSKNVLYSGDIDLCWPERFSQAKRPAGLVNNAMACYSNATLQVLLHTPPVLQMAVEHNDCPVTGFCMLCELRSCIRQHWSGSKRYMPDVQKKLGKVRKGFSKNRQEDTHEFFRFVTDALQNTALFGKPKELPEKIKRTTWVYRTWGGQVRSRVLCLSCKKPSDTFDSFLDLSLDVPARSKTVKDLLDVFVHEDKLDGDNKYNCENCKRKSAATKSMRIAEAPPILTLHLKRFGYSLTYPSRMTKVNNLIDYPPVLDIASYMTEDATDGTRYRLFAVTNHHGSSLHYGHYTSYVRGADGTWYDADDEDVRPLSPKDVLHERSAYLVSYVRMGKGEKIPPTATPTAATNGNFKRTRDESPSPVQKRPSPSARMIGPVRPTAPALSPVKAKPIANGSASSLDGLMRAYESSDDEPTLPKRNGFANGHHGGPKGKHHRLDHKAGATGQGHRKGNHHGHGKRRGAPMPFAAGHKKSSNMRSGSRYDAPKKGKGMIKRMQGRP